MPIAELTARYSQPFSRTRKPGMLPLLMIAPLIAILSFGLVLINANIAQLPVADNTPILPSRGTISTQPVRLSPDLIILLDSPVLPERSCHAETAEPQLAPNMAAALSNIFDIQYRVSDSSLIVGGFSIRLEIHPDKASNQPRWYVVVAPLVGRPAPFGPILLKL